MVWEKRNAYIWSPLLILLVMLYRACLFGFESDASEIARTFRPLYTKKPGESEHGRDNTLAKFETHHNHILITSC